MNYCTNQGHDDLSGNWDDPRRILWPLFWSLSPSPLLTFVSWHTHSLFYSLFSLFFLLIPSSSSSLPFSLSTFQLFLLEISPQAENLVIVVESDTGGSHGIREASRTISFVALYWLSWNWTTQGTEKNKAEAPADGYYKKRGEEEKWPLQPPDSARPGNVHIPFLVHTFLVTQKELVRVLLGLCIKEPI